MTDTAAIAAPGETLTYDLIVPIMVDGKEVTRLTLKEPDMGDMCAAALAGGGDPAQEMAAQLAAACGLSLPDAKRIKVRDMRAIMSACRPWLIEGNGSGSDN
ncbi:phage tail assembly protein [Pannonibacter sp. P2PFMT1]|uniref:phage tail assembly protein n=1 Tax=Pannonibacter sp. P2PFMT1 TaxID=2003582 RepID=UPI0016497030|nr:phage tail assembly protein [Pannonibacter sp. P2PFMT1]